MLAIAAATGCSFTAGDPGAGQGSTGPDGGGSAARKPCDFTDSTLQLCLDFDDIRLGLDASPGHHDANVSSVNTMARTTTELAAVLSSASTIQVPKTAALDIVGAISYELWINPAVAPSSRFYGIDNTGQYGLSIMPDKRVRCTIAGMHVDSLDSIALGAWTHVGCTYEGATLTVFINGGVADCYNMTLPISTSGTAGTSIGSPFVGAVDNVHVLARAITPAEMCTRASQSGCEASCPEGGGGGGGGD